MQKFCNNFRGFLFVEYKQSKQAADFAQLIWTAIFRFAAKCRKYNEYSKTATEMVLLFLNPSFLQKLAYLTVISRFDMK